MKTLLVAIVLALATPAFAGQFEQQEIANQLQYQNNMIMQQQLNDNMNRAIEANQAAVNRGLETLQPHRCGLFVC